MNRRIGFVVVMLAALAGMGAVLLFLSRPPAAAPDVEPVPEELVYDAGSGGDTSALRAVTVRNNRGEYTLAGGEKPVIDGFEGIPMDSYGLGRVLGVSARLVSRGLVTSDAASLAVFGLDPPSAEVLVQPLEGEAAEILVGSRAPDGSNVYVKLRQRPEIFLAASYEADVFLKGALEFVSIEITPQAKGKETGELPFERIILGGAARRGEAVTIANTGFAAGNGAPGIMNSPCRITSPVDAALSMDKGLPPLEALFGLSADRIAAKISANGELGRYGLAEPWSTVEVNGKEDGENFRLRASKPDSAGTAYILREGSPLVYEADVSKLPWLELSWFDMMEKLIILPFIDNISGVDVKTPARTVSFSLSGEGDDLTVKAGTAAVDLKIFRTYYQTLIGASYGEQSNASFASLPPPFLEIIYHYRDGKNADTVSFHRADSPRRVFVSLNRGRTYFTFSAYTDQVLADLDKVLAGERVRSYL
jgi:hypothetical protein